MTCLERGRVAAAGLLAALAWVSCQGATLTTGGAAREENAARAAGPGRIDEELSVRLLALDTYLVVHEPFVAANVLAPAARTFDEHEGLVLRFGAEEVRVVYPGAAHSPDNVVVFFPSRGVLFGGCMIKGSASVGFIGDADLDHWESAVDSVRALGAKIVIPGHGPVGGAELFDLTTSVVRTARAGKK